MIARITRARKGISKYLRDGHRQDSEYTRTEKDNVIPLYGNLDIFEKTEKYLNDNKNYKHNYLHITISYSKEDMLIMDTMSYEEKIRIKNDIVMTYIKHHTSGYDIDNEVIAYAETHQPIIKEEHGKERFEHEHIVIALYNPLSDTKLRTTFANNSFIDDTLQAYINKKYGLTQPRERIRERQGIEADTQMARDRKYYIEELKYIKSKDELIRYFKNNNMQYKEVKTKNNHYYKIINKKGKDINLRGKGFEHIHNMTVDENYMYNEKKDIAELEKILNKYYQERISQIDKRRSKASKEAMKDIYKEQYDNAEYSISVTSYQEKIFYKHYKQFIKNDLTGYSININDNINPRFINKAKNIYVEDAGDKIVSHTNDNKNLQERVRLMLNIAVAKKWKLSSMKVSGSAEFVAEVERQIADRIRLENQLQNKSKKTLSYTAAAAVNQEIDKRPTTAVQAKKKRSEQRKEKEMFDKDVSLTLLKNSLQAEAVLAYAIEKYKINPNNYEITSDNKINNKNNRQKPKNVIDFLQKEIHIKTSEAIEKCRELYRDQPLNINADNEREGSNMSLKISICKDTSPNALNKWEQVEVKNYSELAAYMKQYPYSAAEFEKGYRKGDNVKSFNNILIYDIDNDKGSPQLSINEAKEILKKHNISAMILPSKSHNAEKHGHIAERYRIVIPINRAIDINDKDTYREFQKITAKALKIDKYVDTKALNDKARYYYRSPIKAEPMIIKSDRVMSIDRLEQRAKANIEKRDKQREAEQRRAKEIRENIKQYQRYTRAAQSNNLTYADVDKIIQLDIRELINRFEKQSERYKEGSYEMIKTPDAKYSIIEKNVAHDFKSDVTFNSLTYLQYKINTTNLNILARELEKITGENYMQVNYQRVKEVLHQARGIATNDKSFEEYIKDSFGVRYVKLGSESIAIADREINLNDIGMSKYEIVNDLRANRQSEELELEQSRNYYRRPKI